LYAAGWGGRGWQPGEGSAGVILRCFKFRILMIVLIDNGHGVDTPGKQSPDGRLREWAWTRAMARSIVDGLREAGIDARTLVPEEYDLPLLQRVNRVNALCRLHGAANVVLVSVHNNAAGADGCWHSARGFLPLVVPNASRASRRLASILYTGARSAGLSGNRAPLSAGYVERNLYICRHTLCPAVLTENLFQDNRDDVDFLLSDRGRRAIRDLHVNAIKEYFQM